MVNFCFLDFQVGSEHEGFDKVLLLYLSIHSSSLYEGRCISAIGKIKHQSSSATNPQANWYISSHSQSETKKTKNSSIASRRRERQTAPHKHMVARLYYFFRIKLLQGYLFASHHSIDQAKTISRHGGKERRNTSKKTQIHEFFFPVSLTRWPYWGRVSIE